MNARTSIDEMLAKARQVSPDYTAEEMAAAEARLEAKAAGWMVSGAISFDDATYHRLRRHGRHAVPCQEPAADAPEDRPRRARTDLQRLCHVLISQPEALHAMSTFIGGRVLEPSGARVLACVLHLAGREDSARFWWQYAAGADDVAASYCLYLHHMTLGETEEADWWQDQVSPLHGAELRSDGADRYALALGWTTCLRIVVRHRAFTDATTAALAYVRNAVQFVDDDLDLPLPDDGFAERIEQITALV
jgi:hypothetical protein